MENQSENRTCQNCKNDFAIEPDDFSFYEKIKVPPPTFCYLCRAQRRMIWRNEHNLFKKKDESSGELIFSAHSEESPIKIYNNEYWWSDAWDPIDFGHEYDFSISFFEQFKELLYSVPVPARVNLRAVNSDYSNNASELKNCYLCFNSIFGEDCLYGIHFNKMKRSVNFSSCSTSEECCNAFNITDCYKVFHTSEAAECVDVRYSFDCRNCSNCLGCVGLRHKNYCIFNEQYTKEEYFKKLKELNLGSYSSEQNIVEYVTKLMAKHPRKYMHTMKSTDVSGDYVFGSKNVKNSVMTFHGYDVKYSQDVRNTKDAYDVLIANYTEGFLYENSICGLESSYVQFSVECYSSCLELSYCVFCSSSSYLFACVGLRNKKYCIFNKQYSKEEYFEIVEKIKKHMDEMPFVDAKGIVYKYGEFFPKELSFFTYNDTIAQEYFPLTKEEAEERGYKWRDTKKKNNIPTVLNNDIPDDIKNVPEDFVNESIECIDREACDHNCSKAFKVIESELAFYKKNLIPLPRKCPNCRHYERISMRNSLKLWKRSCMCQKEHLHHKDKCEVEFETSYAPDRPEIVYCEKCYQSEVY